MVHCRLLDHTGKSVKREDDRHENSESTEDESNLVFEALDFATIQLGAEIRGLDLDLIGQPTHLLVQLS